MWTDEEKKELLEAFEMLPEDIRNGLRKTILRQAENYRLVIAKPKLRLVVNGVRR